MCFRNSTSSKAGLQSVLSCVPVSCGIMHNSEFSDECSQFALARRQTFELGVEQPVLGAETFLKARESISCLPAIDGDECRGLIGRMQQFCADIAVCLREELCPGAVGLVGGDECGDLLWPDNELPDDDVHFHFPA